MSPGNNTPPSGRPTGRPVVLGEVLFDRFPDGQAVLGGAPFNVAWHLRGFGENPLFISRVGEDNEGEKVRKSMQDWGMDLAGLQKDSRYPTGTVSVTVHGTEPSFHILPDQAYDHLDASCIESLFLPIAKSVSEYSGPQRGGCPIVPPARRELGKDKGCSELHDEIFVPSQGHLLYHGTMILRTAAMERLVRELLADTGLPIFLDVNLRSPWWCQSHLPPILRRARWVKVNKEELTTIAGNSSLSSAHMDRKEDTDTIVKIARRVQDKFGIELLIVTCGARGAMALDKSGELFLLGTYGANTEIVDTVGAGDAFSAVVIKGLLHDWPLSVTLQRAGDFATRVCQLRGATIADMDFYRMNSLW